ncbi:MAG: arginase [Crocinitomicaceae bacterium]|jgi:arginase
MKQIQLIINKSEITAGTRGASLGPEAVKTAARKKNNLFFGKYPQIEVKDMNHLLDQPTEYKHAKRINGFVEVFQNVAFTVEETISKGRFPLLLASDHGSAAGTIAGLRQAYPNLRLGVIWIDAHGDLHTPYTTPSGNMHGMPLAAALGVDNLECQSNEPHEDVKKMWMQLKEMGAAGAKFLPENLVFIGVRDTEPQEDAIIDRFNITNHTVEDVRAKGADEILRLTLEQLEECDIVYVSFDVDSMDPEITSHGTGTPVDNGLTIEEARTFVCGLAKHDKLACMEFVEVNPCLDEKTNKMAEVTFELFEAAANCIAE